MASFTAGREDSAEREAAGERLAESRERLPADTADIVAWALEHRLLLGAGAFALVSIAPLSEAIWQQGHAWAVLALLAIPAAIVLRGKQRLAALALVGGGIVLRLALAGVWQADPVQVSAFAGYLALRGFNPYGGGLAVSEPPGAPFPYGPLALLWDYPGVVVETAASVATMLLFVLTGSWITLGFYAADNLAVHSATQGVNDLSPGLLIAGGLLLLRRKPLLGGVVLAMAAAIKPYAFAWFPAAVGYAGLPALVGLVGASIVLWSPLLVWGIAGYLKSIALAREVHPLPNALNVPELRVLGVPLAIGGLLVRRWEVAVAAGAVVFAVVLFFDRWASQGYWLAVIPIAGIALEEWAVRQASQFVAARRRSVAGVGDDERALGSAERPLAGIPLLGRSWAEQPIVAEEPRPDHAHGGRSSGEWPRGP